MASCVSFSSFPTNNPAAVRAKLTFVGVQERAVRSLAFSVGTATVDPTAFVPCQSASVSYVGDAPPITVASLTSAEMSSLLQAAGTVPAVVSGGVSSSPYLSFSLFDGTSTGFEVVLDKPNGTLLVQAIRAALLADLPVWQAVNIFGCSADLKEPGTPTDVTSSVQVTISGLRLNRTTGRFVGTVTAKNTSASSISGPVSIVFILGGQVQLHSPTGMTCGTSPEGYGFQNLVLQNNSLAAGATVSFTLDVDNPALETVAPTIKVLAGAGSR